MSVGDESAAVCPLCGAPRPPEAPDCLRCGVVFARVHSRASARPEGARPPAARAADPLERASRAGRALLLCGLAVWTWQFARLPMGAGVMDSVLHLPNLVFHEAGHVLFTPFGRFMTVLGGSLFQVALPVGIAVAFLRQHDPFGASICAWWAGENLLDLAPYIADARALQLVLLGGHTGAEVEGHDWEYLLTTLGWMPYDRTLGLAAHRLGLLAMAAALIWGAAAVRRHQARDLQLEEPGDR